MGFGGVWADTGLGASVGHPGKPPFSYNGHFFNGIVDILYFFLGRAVPTPSTRQVVHLCLVGSPIDKKAHEEQQLLPNESRPCAGGSINGTLRGRRETKIMSPPKRFGQTQSSNKDGL